jgi:Putative homoserine kinase type II (protein kinase fold)
VHGGAPESVAAAERAALALLTGPTAGEMLAVALARDGAHLEGWEVHELHHRPGAGVTVGYTVSYEVAGSSRSDYLLLSTARLSREAVEAGRAVVLDDGVTRVVAWRHPLDPELPALELACDPVRVTELLVDAGLLPPGEGADVELLAYRPTRRAVLRVRAESATWYVKVLRPDQLGPVSERHAMLAEAGLPTPRVVHAHPDGLVVLNELGGTPLASALARDGAADLDPMRLVEILDRLPDTLMNLAPRPAWSDRIAHHGQAAQAALPEEAQRIAAAVARIQVGSEVARMGPTVPTHGDFYEAQLFVDRGEVVGLLDVDTAGPGSRVDDLACLLGHLDVLPALAPEVYPHVPQVVERWLATFEQVVDPVALRVRTAGVVLSLVAGARTKDEARSRLERAEAWLGDATLRRVWEIVGRPRLEAEAARNLRPR